MSWQRVAVSLAAVVVAAAIPASIVFGLSGGSESQGTRAASPSPSSDHRGAQSHSAPSPAKKKPKKPAKPKPRRVLAVKIDNASAARPQHGLTRADVVYVEPVEAGLSRLMAIYWPPRIPQYVGPVRSARESDMRILRQFGRPSFAYSGAHSRVLPMIHRAPLQEVSPAQAGGAYFRSSSRPAPSNLFAHPNELYAAAAHPKRGRALGLHHGKAPYVPKKRTFRYTVRYKAASFTFTWAKKKDRWRVWMDGSRAYADEGGRLRPKAVVIQRVTIKASDIHDFLGNATPYAETVGSGRALVLRDGRAYPARWKREKSWQRTEYTTRKGKPMTFPNGQVWIVLTKRH